MGTDKSKEFELKDSEKFSGKPNIICPHCKKIDTYNGNRRCCPFCGKRYNRYTVTNSQGIKERVN